MDIRGLSQAWTGPRATTLGLDSMGRETGRAARDSIVAGTPVGVFWAAAAPLRPEAQERLQDVVNREVRTVFERSSNGDATFDLQQLTDVVNEALSGVRWTATFVLGAVVSPPDPVVSPGWGVVGESRAGLADCPGGIGRPRRMIGVQSAARWPATSGPRWASIVIRNGSASRGLSRHLTGRSPSVGAPARSTLLGPRSLMGRS